MVFWFIVIVAEVDLVQNRHGENLPEPDMHKLISKKKRDPV